jgi:hypothetical protein
MPTNVGVAALAAPTPLPTSALPPPKDPSPPGVEAHLLSGVPDGCIGPFVARRGDVVLGAYVGVSAEGARRVVSIPLLPSGDTHGDARVVAPVASDATMLVLRPSGGPKAGFIAAWTYLTDRGEALSVVGIADDGRPRGDAVELARTSDDIVWMDVVPTSRGAVALWIEQPHGGVASVLAVALGGDGAMRGVPARIARGVSGWQVVGTDEGVGLAVVSPDSEDKTARKERRTSTISWRRLDADAHIVGAPVVVASGVRMLGDVDAVRAGSDVVLAWTDGAQPDPQPMVAVLDPHAAVRGPKRAIDGGFGGTLVGLAAGDAGTVLAWEEPARRGRASKRVMLARVDPMAPAVDTAHALPLELQGRGAPELAAAKGGFALLGPANLCEAGAPCTAGAVVPTFVRLDAKLDVTQVEPLRIGALHDHASTGWGLSCSTGGAAPCLALAATAAQGDSSPHLYTLALGPRTTPFRAPIATAPPAGAPVVAALDTVVLGEPIAELASAHLGSGSIVATLASTNDPAAKRDDDAVVAVRVFGAPGSPPGAAAIVTKRALPVGGVAIATTDRAEDGAAVAWVARDAGDPQVHVTRVDSHGKVLRDVRLTSARGDATDVAVAWSGERWVVAWVDTRDGNGEVYAATLGRDGRDIGKGQRITNAPGDASDVAILALPGGAGPDGRGLLWLAWSDPRESPQDGFADVYVAQLRAKDASRAGDEVRVLATAAHSRSPALASVGNDVALAWIEEAPMGTDPTKTQAYGAMLAWLAPGGAPAAEPKRLPVAGEGFPTALALEGTSATLHAVLAQAAADMVTIDGIDLVPRSSDPLAPFPLVTLDGPPSLDVTMALAGEDLFFNDESSDADTRRVRRATIRWRR